MTDDANTRPQPSPEDQPVQPASETPAPAAQPAPASDPAPQPVPVPAPDQAPQPVPAPAPQPYSQPYAQQPYAPAPVYGAPPPVAPPAAPGSGKALAALICGICAIVFAGTVVVGVALGVVAIVLAVQYVKQFGKDAKATAGKVCGIAGIVFSALMLAFYLFMGALVIETMFDYANDSQSRRATPAVPDTGTRPDTTQPGPSAPDAGSQAADVAEATQAAVAELDKVKNPDQATLGLIAREADKEFGDDLGFTLTEVGIDPVEFAAWLAEGMDYSLVDGDVRLRADGEGEVFATAQARNFKDLVRGLAGQTGAYVSPERFDHGAPVLDESAKTALAGLVRAAMGEVPTTPSSLSIDVMKLGGAWTVEHDELNSIIDDVFDL